MLGIASPALAAGPLGGDGTPLDTSGYTLDLFQGPVLSSARVTALGGAYTPLAEGVDGLLPNPAAAAVRPPQSFDITDYAFSASATAPRPNTDFDNDGTRGVTYENFRFATVGALVQHGDWGFGLSIEAQTVALGESATLQAPVDVTTERGVLVVARSFAGGQVVLGGGLRYGTLSLESASQKEDLLSITSSGGLFGVVVAPANYPFRLGLAARGTTATNPEDKPSIDFTDDGDLVFEGRYFPKEVRIPWELEGGIAVELGERPLNVGFVNPAHAKPPDGAEVSHEFSTQAARLASQARYRHMPRQRLLLVASVLLSGRVEQAVGLESFLEQEVRRSGERISITPRLGCELEPLPNRLVLRSGLYIEPTRFEGSHARPHVTMGADLRLFSWSAFGLYDDDTGWRAGLFGDMSRDYAAWGLAVGLWY